MTIHRETRNAPQHKPGRIRRNDRRAAIARKAAWLTDSLNTRH